MSRPKKDLNELERTGALKKNPQRYRERIEQAKVEAKLPPIGPPPERWNLPDGEIGARKFAALREIWQEFAPQVSRSNPAGRALLEMFCEAMYKFRTDSLHMRTSEKAYLLQLAKSMGQGASANVEKPDGTSGGSWSEFDRA